MQTQNYISPNTIEWNILIHKLKKCTEKSNRDYLCVYCWVVIPFCGLKIHIRNFPDHESTILTSKHFAKEHKFVALARSLHKVKGKG